MPLYDYQCVNCQTRELRLAAVDDHTAICTHCDALMFRQDQDLFAPYFTAPSPDCPWCGQTQPGTSRICPRHAAELKAEVKNWKKETRP